MRTRIFRIFVPVAAALIAACIIDDFGGTVIEHPVASGRYYKASEIAVKPRDSALFYTEFSDSGHRYLDVELTRPGCPTFLHEGTWHAFTSDDKPELQLRKRYKQVAGSNWNTDCLSVDSLVALDDGDGEVVSLRGVTDTSFETCDTHYEVCFGLCTAGSLDIHGRCMIFDGDGTNDTDWTLWTK